MKRVAIAVLLATFALSPAMAQSTCQSKSSRQRRQAPRWSGIEQLSYEVSEGYLRTESYRQEWKAAQRRREGKLLEEMSERGIGRLLSPTMVMSAHTGPDQERASS